MADQATLHDLCSSLLQRPIAFHRVFATITEGALPGLFLSQAYYWSQRTSDANGWFYKTQQEWEEETALNRRDQETARKRLRHLGILEEKKQGIPAKLYYRINQEKLHACLAESAILGRRKRTNLPVRIRQTIPETTTEITTETTRDNPSSVSLRSTSSPQGEKRTRTRQRTAASKCCPADWQPSPETEAWAAEKFPHINVLDALEAMKDYEFRTPHSDWDKTLRTWIRRSVGHRQGAQQETPAQALGLTEKEYRTMRNLNNSVKHYREQRENGTNGGTGVPAFLSGPKRIGPGV